MQESFESVRGKAWIMMYLYNNIQKYLFHAKKKLLRVVLKGIDNWWPLSFLEPRFLHKPSNPHLLYYRKHHKNQKLKKKTKKKKNLKPKPSNPLLSQTQKRPKTSEKRCSLQNKGLVGVYLSFEVETSSEKRLNKVCSSIWEARGEMCYFRRNRHFKKLQPVAINRNYPFNEIISRFSF